MSAERSRRRPIPLLPITPGPASAKVNVFDTTPKGIEAKKAAYLKILEKALGVKSSAARALGIDRRTVNNWIHADAEFAAAVLEIQEHAIDFVETHLFKSIQAGNVASIIFYLKTKGRSRGYVERVERVGTLEAPPVQVSASVITVADLKDEISPKALETVYNGIAEG
ncbi:hypothetical protein DB346_11590 [Verrucomicrobia bacterium LW23]|nr:hypothetical protein DB346_11590 [Verrucomicrobia bacterium LW23]